MACSRLWKNPHPSPTPPSHSYCMEKSVHWEGGRKEARFPALPVLSLHFSLSGTASVLGRGSFSLFGGSPVGPQVSVMKPHTPTPYPSPPSRWTSALGDLDVPELLGSCLTRPVCSLDLSPSPGRMVSLLLNAPLPCLLCLPPGLAWPRALLDRPL